MSSSEGSGSVSLSRSEFWMRVSAALFSVWALVIPIGIEILRSSFNDMLEQQRATASRLDSYVLQMERRTTIVESRQESMMIALQRQQEKIDRIETLSETRPASHASR